MSVVFEKSNEQEQASRSMSVVFEKSYEQEEARALQH